MMSVFSISLLIGVTKLDLSCTWASFYTREFVLIFCVIFSLKKQMPSI